jgi:hypothetical protein
MLKVKQSIRNTEATVMTSLRVLGQEDGRAIEVPGKEANVDVAAFCEHLQSKQTIIPADRKDRLVIWMRWLENQIEARYEATGGGLEIIADVLEMGLEDPLHFRFAFICTGSKGGLFERHPFAIACEESEHLKQFIELLATRTGVQHPDLAAVAAVLVIEETIVRAGMTAEPVEAHTARLLFQCLQHA